jgi:hypothetical protein
MNRLFNGKVMTFLFLILLLLVVGCKPKTPTLAFEDTEFTVTEEEEFDLTPIITNLEGDDLVDYTFDVTGIVTEADGVFTAVAEGVVHITATLKGYPDISVVITVTVEPLPPVLVTSITVGGETTMVEEEEQT